MDKKINKKNPQARALPTTKAPKRDPVAALLRKIDTRLNVIENRLERVTKAQEGQWSKNEQHWDWLYPKVADVWHARAPKKEPDALHGEPWVPVKGDYIVRITSAEKVDAGMVGIVDEVCVDRMHWCRFPHWPERICCDERFIRPATSEEVEAHLEAERVKEWEGRKSLEERDACETTEAQWNELLCIAGDLVRNDEHNDYQHSPNVRWDTYGTVTGLFKTSPVQKWDMGYGLKWLPFPVFKRLLIAEVERKKEEEAKKPLHLRFLDSVKVKDCDERAVFWQKVDDEYWVLLEHGGIHHLKRDQISVL